MVVYTKPKKAKDYDEREIRMGSLLLDLKEDKL